MPRAADKRSATELPLYTLPEAARHTRIPIATVRSWVKGREYRIADGRKRFERVIQPDDPVGKLLSFKNIAELQALRAMRAVHEIPLHEIRRAVAFLRKEFDTERPLIDHQFYMDTGRRLFTNYLESFFVIRPAEGQLYIREAIERHLSRIDVHPGRGPVRFFPTLDSDEEAKPIVLDPTVEFGRPVLTGTRIPVDEIVARRAAGEGERSLAKDYGRSLEEIRFALEYGQAA